MTSKEHEGEVETSWAQRRVRALLLTAGLVGAILTVAIVILLLPIDGDTKVRLLLVTIAPSAMLTIITAWLALGVDAFADQDSAHVAQSVLRSTALWAAVLAVGILFLWTGLTARRDAVSVVVGLVLVGSAATGVIRRLARLQVLHHRHRVAKSDRN